MVQGTGLPFHCSLLNQFCPWTNSSSIYQHYLAENLNVAYIAVNLSGQTWRHELIQVSSCSQVCLYGYTSRSWCGEPGARSTPSPHVGPSLSPATLPPQSTWRGRMAPSVPCRSHSALKGFCHPGRWVPVVQTPHWSHPSPCMLTRVGESSFDHKPPVSPIPSCSHRDVQQDKQHYVNWDLGELRRKRLSINVVEMFADDLWTLIIWLQCLPFLTIY